MRDGLPPGVFRTALRFILESQGNKILDVGAGDGVLSFWLQKYGKIVSACDISPEKFVVKGINCDKVDLNYKMPYPDSSFDIVAACEVMEHIENQKNMLDEVHRVLKPNGVFVFTTPNVHNWYSKLYFLFTNKFPYFRRNDYSILGHTRPLILNLFREHIKGKFVIEKMAFNRAFIPKLHLPLPWKNLWFGECIIVKLRKIP